MTVSIIIAVKTWQKNLEECVAECQGLDYPDFEIIILPDLLNKDCLWQRNSSLKQGPDIQIIPTGIVTPPQKRDMALACAKGEILAFIDDDAYPMADWLKKAIENFKDTNIAAVGGPALTPLSDSLKQRASGYVYSSLLVSGKFAYRYLPGKKREVDDYPSCNFLVRKSVMLELGGFDTSFWPGEDTKLCLDIIKRLGKKIIYDPQVIVYHHRRPLFLAHLEQVANYALHRGYFVKRYPETSLKLSYFVPSLFLAFLIIGGGLSLNIAGFRPLYSFSTFFYLVLVLIFSVCKELRLIPWVFFGIIFTHFTYGIYFLLGLFSRKLKEEQ